jgi:hypothetical protein
MFESADARKLPFKDSSFVLCSAYSFFGTDGMICGFPERETAESSGRLIPAHRVSAAFRAATWATGSEPDTLASCNPPLTDFHPGLTTGTHDIL